MANLQQCEEQRQLRVAQRRRDAHELAERERRRRAQRRAEGALAVGGDLLRVRVRIYG